MALETGTGKTVEEEGEGSAQVGQLWALLLAVENGATIIYTDSYATFQGATEWICQWKSSKREVGHAKVWRTEDWQRLLAIGRSRPLKVGWVKGHARDGTPAAKWNQQVDHLAQIRMVTSEKEDWDRLAEWLHIKKGHSGQEDLYYECPSRGWPVSMKTREAILTACPQCPIRLNANHPNQAPAQHIRQGKALWSTWQADYSGPLRPSSGRKYILVGVEVASGLSVATAVGTATADQTVQVL